MIGDIADTTVTKVMKSGCMGEWCLIFHYANGAQRSLAFANKEQLVRAVDVVKLLMKQQNTVIELGETSCDAKTVE